MGFNSGFKGLKIEYGTHILTAELLPGKNRYPLCRRVGRPQGRSGQVRKISPLTGIRSPDRPSHSQSLYALRYPAPCALIGRCVPHRKTEISNKFTATSLHFAPAPLSYSEIRHVRSYRISLPIHTFVTVTFLITNKFI
jgi:hypothetical protein